MKSGHEQGRAGFWRIAHQLKTRTRYPLPTLRPISFLLTYAILAGLVVFGFYNEAVLLTGIVWLAAAVKITLASRPLRRKSRQIAEYLFRFQRRSRAQRPRVWRIRNRPARYAAWLAELVIVVSVAWQVTWEFRNTDPEVRIHGKELEYLTSSATQAFLNLREDGYISLWQPWLENGEPLITSPFAFVLNPLSSGPVLLWGVPNGLKFSMVFYAVFAGVGGWMLGFVLGLGTLGRVLLGVLLVGKGYNYSALAGGFFQLSVSQAYMPWIIAGTLAIVRYPHKRWPAVLTAVMITLLFWAGNLWYTLPTLVSVAVVMLGFTVCVGGKLIDAEAWRRLALSAFIAVCLSAATLFPMWQQRAQIDHPDEVGAGRGIALEKVLPLYYDADAFDRIEHSEQERPQAYYHFAIPGWFLLFLFLIVPPFLPPLFSHPFQPQMWRVWLVGAVLIAAMTIWGAGGFSITEWLYSRVELLREWRFVGRALAVGAFWIAVLAASRADSILHAILYVDWPRLRSGRLLLRGSQVLLVAALLYLSAKAADEVLGQWGRYGTVEQRNYRDAVCLTWLREQEPDAPLTVWRFDYDTVQPFLENKVRIFNIEVAYHALPLPFTVSQTDLTRALPEYAMVWSPDVLPFLVENGYQEVEASPDAFNNGFGCLFRRAGAFDYTFSVPHRQAEADLRVEHTRPIHLLKRTNDRISVRADADPEESTVVVVHELAYPGWHAYVDGKAVPVESVGGMIGVILPAGDETHEIAFEFRPKTFIFAGWLSVATALACVLYLLRAEHIVSAVWRGMREWARETLSRQVQRDLAADTQAGQFLTQPGGQLPVRTESEPNVAVVQGLDLTAVRAGQDYGLVPVASADTVMSAVVQVGGRRLEIVLRFRLWSVIMAIWLSMVTALTLILYLLWAERFVTVVRRRVRRWARNGTER
ncbi:MAG: hypothetical protein KBH93_02695 [Anaerolineae bacterium]|nr:hypothetical protein [Anaerolineae bacterium]